MLVTSRQRDETLLIGNAGTVMAVLTPLEEQALRQCTEPQLMDLASRLLATRGPIQVTVVDIRGDKVRIGVKAPEEISIHRKEVLDAIRKGAARNPHRSLIAVLDEVIAIIPKAEADLLRELTWLKESALFTAPEAMVERWRVGAEILCRRIGSPAQADGWKKRAASIWTGVAA